MKNKKKFINVSNNGFTLIEVIIVIAIISIISTGAILTVSHIGYMNTEKTAKIINMEMETVRMATMTKSESYYLYLYKIDGTLYMKTSTESMGNNAGLNESSGKKLAVNCSVAYQLFEDEDTEPTGELSLSDGAFLQISFIRSSGAFSSGYKYIKITNGNHSSKIDSIKETGRHLVE